MINEAQGIILIVDATDPKSFEDAYKALYTIAQNGGKVLFVGTRKQTQDVIKEEATRANMVYVDQR